MQVLVATKETQGQRKNDFSHASEGELVRFGSECDGGHVDDSCGCKRSLVGMDSSKGTTTFAITERPDLTRAKLVEMLRAAMTRDGWIDKDSKDATERKQIANEVDELLRIAQCAPVGTVLEKRGANIRSRVSRPKG